MSQPRTGVCFLTQVFFLDLPSEFPLQLGRRRCPDPLTLVLSPCVFSGSPPLWLRGGWGRVPFWIPGGSGWPILAQCPGASLGPFGSPHFQVCFFSIRRSARWPGRSLAPPLLLLTNGGPFHDFPLGLRFSLTIMFFPLFFSLRCRTTVGAAHSFSFFFSRLMLISFGVHIRVIVTEVLSFFNSRAAPTFSV